MFQFPPFPPSVLCVQTEVTPHDGCWVSPFGHLRINAQSTAPRSFSQSLTSFIGSWRQGIHRWLFVAWKNKDARACSAVLKGHRHDGGTSIERMRNTPSFAAGPWPMRTTSRDRDRRPQNRREDQIERDSTTRGRSLRTMSRDDRPTSAPTGSDSSRPGRMPDNDRVMLLRKEVIQPHLPVRLPCYDFTPITDPTFDGSLLAVGPPASGVADFRGVTGGVYKARERIHPGVLIRDY
jgi:hypothetical protein